jgi:hypothetical protein
MKDRRGRNRRRDDFTPHERDVRQEVLLEEWLERKARARDQLVECAWCHIVKPISEFRNIETHRQCLACARDQVAASKRGRV